MRKEVLYEKIFKKSNIFAFILGAIVFGSIGVVSAYTILATDIGYTPIDNTWKKENGEDITNVGEAIDELYNKASIDLLWTNSNLTQAFPSQTISLNLSSYKYIVVVSKFNISYENTPRSSAIVPIGNYSGSIGLGITGAPHSRSVRATTSEVWFGDAYYGSTKDNNAVIPYKIYGIKQNFNIDIGTFE